MASSSRISTILLLIAVINTAVVTAIPPREYSSLLSALRFRGYHVFANAICTTDIHSDILSGSNFTLFIPVDSSLYALDMTMSSSDYTVAMRFHIVPYRLTLPDLRQLPYGSNPFPTLVQGHEIHVVNPIPLSLPVMVEGVNVAFPGLYYDTHIAVHGLEGTIDPKSQTETETTNSTSNLKNDVAIETHAPSPRNKFVSGVNTVGSPVPMSSVVQSPDISPAYVESTPVNPPRRQPVTQFDSITHPHEEHVSSEISSASGESIPIVARRRQPVTRSESITQPREVHTSIEMRSDLLSQRLHESITHPRDEEAFTPPIEINNMRIHDVSLAKKVTGVEDSKIRKEASELNSQSLRYVSLAAITAKSNDKHVEEYTQVDDKVNDCLVAAIDNDGNDELKIANIHHGDVYMSELYETTRMTCADE